MNFSQTNRQHLHGITFRIIVITITFLMILSLRPWFLWGINQTLVRLITFLILLLCLIDRINFSFFNKYFLVISFFIIAYLWNFTDKIWTLPIPFLVALLLDNNERERVLTYWTNIYAAILIISLVAWLLTFTGRLPDYGTISSTAQNHIYTNYLFCLKGFIYPFRFHSVFLEPGHVAMIAVFTIYANQYDWKKISVKILLTSVLFTFSLAGYILLVIGYVIFKFQKNGFWALIKTIFLSSIFLSSMFWIGSTYNGGNNFFNQFILERLAFDEDKGISGNNRNSTHTDFIFERSIKNGVIISGMNHQRYETLHEQDDIHGAGYKLYMLERGIIGTIFVLLFYIFLLNTSKDKIFVTGMLFLYVFAFLQRAYPFWYSWLFLFLFVTGITSYKKVTK